MRVKIICSTNSELEHDCKVLPKQFTKRGYGSSLNELKLRRLNKGQVLSLTMTYNRTLPSLKEIIQNH